MAARASKEWWTCRLQLTVGVITLLLDTSASDHDGPGNGSGRQDPELVRFAATGDPALCERLVRRYRPLAETGARRFGRRGVPHDDLFQVANIGLLKAIRRFDPSFERPFAVFAVATIRGELRRYFRDHTWMVRVPRRIKDLNVTLSRVSGDLTERLGRSPTVLELAEEADVDVDLVLEALDARFAYAAEPLLSPGTDGQPTNEPVETSAVLDDLEVRLLLRGHMSVLHPRQRLILHLRFIEDLTQSEIARRLGTSQVSISRQLASAFTVLRSNLSSDLRPEGAG